MKKYKLIIDTDPGVDDSTALILAMFDKAFDIKLITTVSGNVDVLTATRNVCHLLDLFGKNIPVAIGAGKPLFREPFYATEIHGEDGLGNYIPPKVTKTQPISKSAVEAMYEIIMQNPHEIILCLWGPQTNAAELITRHPEVVQFIKKIVFMGASPYGMLDMPEHISFNIKSDPEAFQIVLDSGIPTVMIPSYIGRRVAHLTASQVEDLSLYNNVGKFMALMFDGYWEQGCVDKRVATNDSCALFFIKAPKIFELQSADVYVDVDQDVGKTYARFHKRGKLQMVVGVDRDKYVAEFFRAFRNVDVDLDKSVFLSQKSLKNQNKSKKRK